MAFVLEDRVVETANNPGQGDFELLGAADNSRTFVDGIGNGNTTRYLAVGAEGAEIGVAQVQAGSPDRLLRPGTVKNIDGTTTPVNFSGTVTVACIASVEDVLIRGADIEVGRIKSLEARIVGDGDQLILAPEFGQNPTGEVKVRPRGSGQIQNETIFRANGDVDLTAGRILQAGVPVLESGQNSNGRYVRFADGTQICWREMPNLGPIESTTGSIYCSTRYFWDYPAAFASVPSVVGQGARNNVDPPPVWLSLSFVGFTSSSFWLVSSTTPSSTAFLAELVAFGRWY